MKDLYKQLMNAPFMPVSMETVFGASTKERSLSLYNDYVFYRTTWNQFRSTDPNLQNADSLKIPEVFSIKSFCSRYLSSIDSLSHDSPSVDVPVFCQESMTTLPSSVGAPFSSAPIFDVTQVTNEDLEEDDDEADEDYEEDEEEDR